MESEVRKEAELIAVIIWLLWKHRNEVLFKAKQKAQDKSVIMAKFYPRVSSCPHRKLRETEGSTAALKPAQKRLFEDKCGWNFC